MSSQIWIVNPYGPTTTQLTTPADGSFHSIQWDPAGEYVAFLGKAKPEDDGEGEEEDDEEDDEEEIITQVHGASPDGGGTFQITEFERDVTAFQISPDGGRIAIIAKPETSEEQEAEEEERGRPIVWGEVYDDDWNYLWVAGLDGQSASGFDIYSEPNQHVTSLFWSPDSKQIAYCVAPSPVIRSYYDTDIYLVENAGSSRQLTQMPGYEKPVGWTEAHGLVVQAKNQRLGTSNSMLWSVDLSNGVPVPITVGLDENARYVAATEEFMYVELPYRTMRRLYKIPMANGTATGAPKIISDDKMFYSHFSISEDGTKVGFVGEGPNTPPDIYQTLTEDFIPQIATELHTEIKNVELGQQRVVQWRSDADSEVIEGILTLPVDYEPGTKVPLLLVIHGGPAGFRQIAFGPEGERTLSNYLPIMDTLYCNLITVGQQVMVLGLGD